MSGALRRHRTVSSVVLAAVLVGVGVSPSSPASEREPWTHDLDLVASANPSAADPVDADVAFADVAAHRRVVKSDVVATGSATCDGCRASSTALQVLYVGDSREARLDNTAVAWSQGCGDCGATSLSVQVVVLRGSSALVPNNRALALNAACTSCRTTSVAFQVVVGSPTERRLSREALAALKEWVAGQAEALQSTTAAPDPDPTDPTTTSGDSTAAPPATARVAGKATARRLGERRAQRAAGSALGVLEDLVDTDLGAVTVSSDVDLSR
jgi:hypothetical protein